MSADREAAVVGLLRRAALEDDHRGDRVRAHQVGDVEALDPQRQRVEAERLLQAVERLDALLAAALGLELLLVERERGVALGELEDAALVAALGGAHLDVARRAARPAARRAPARSVARRRGDDDLRRDRQGARRSTAGGTPRRTSPRSCSWPRCRGRSDWRSERTPSRTWKTWALASTPSTRDGDDVDVPTASLATRWRSQQRLRTALQPVALERGLLELARRGGRLHPLLEVALDLPVAAAAGRRCTPSIDSRYSSRDDVVDARRPAALDVVVQARASRERRPGSVPVAGAEQEDLAEQVERGADALGAASTGPK